MRLYNYTPTTFSMTFVEATQEVGCLKRRTQHLATCLILPT